MRAALFSLVALTTPAAAEPPEPITPKGLEWQVRDYGFSPAVRAGDFIFISGVVAGIEKGAETTPESMAAAYERAFSRLQEILGAAGASWRDVVEMTTYHTDLPAQAAVFMAAKNKRMAEPYPAWTAIDIDRLWPDNGITEIRLTAYLPRADR